LVRINRGIRPKLACEENHFDSQSASGWEGAVELLDSRLAEARWTNAVARYVVADHWARYIVVPWSDELSLPQERLVHARELLSAVFGESMSDWTVTLSSAAPGRSCLASALPTELLTALKGTAARRGQKLASIQTQLIVSYNIWRHALPSENSAWFVTVEPGSLAALRVCADGIDRVHAVRIGADWARELNRLKTFGRLASARAADGRVYVDLPDALHVLRPDTAGDLEWLENKDQPLTTLHRLEALRKVAA
jgi:hypothetical protein